MSSLARTVQEYIHSDGYIMKVYTSAGKRREKYLFIIQKIRIVIRRKNKVI